MKWNENENEVENTKAIEVMIEISAKGGQSCLVSPKWEFLYYFTDIFVVEVQSLQRFLEGIYIYIYINFGDEAVEGLGMIPRSSRPNSPQNKKFSSEHQVNLVMLVGRSNLTTLLGMAQAFRVVGFATLLAPRPEGSYLSRMTYQILLGFSLEVCLGMWPRLCVMWTSTCWSVPFLGHYKFPHSSTWICPCGQMTFIGCMFDFDASLRNWKG